MNKPLTILIVEDDQDDCIAFVNYTDTVEDVKLVGVTNNDKKAMEYVKDYLPDAVILDLELHKGSGSGISFLEALQQMMRLTSAYSPYVLVTTHNISYITHEQARQLGADFIMVKSQEDYSAKNVIDFLISLKEIIKSSHNKKQGIVEIKEESPAETRNRLKARITVEMDGIGISSKAKGRSYLIDIIIQKVESKSHQTTTIAKKYEKTTASVERAMQNAINSAWSSMPPEDLLRRYTAIIREEKGVPTLTEFICYYANKLETEYFG